MTTAKRRLIRGARAIAEHLFGTDDDWRTITLLQGELPIFHLGGRLVAYADALDAAMKAKEDAACKPRRGRTRHTEDRPAA